MMQIQEMDNDTLEELHKQLVSGELRERVEAEIKKHRKECPTCHAAIRKDEGFTLYFGPKDFRKRATFDALDCMIHFTSTKLR